jgi:hypothetical protein
MNLEFGLEAVQRLSIEARQGLLLRIVGYGPLEGSLRLKAESLGLNDMVEFAGPRKHSQLPKVYHSADVLLLPSEPLLPCVTGSHWAGLSHFAKPNNVIKVNVEGREGAVLDGTRGLLCDRRLQSVGFGVRFGILQERGEKPAAARDPAW